MQFIQSDSVAVKIFNRAHFGNWHPARRLQKAILGSYTFTYFPICIPLLSPMSQQRVQLLLQVSSGRAGCPAFLNS